MSTFKITVTPTRIRQVEFRNVEREPTIVMLEPFTPKSIVTFDEIPLTKTARRFLIIKNTTDEPLSIKITKLVDPIYMLQYEWTENTIVSRSEISLELVWSPIQLFSKQETIHLTDSRGFKKDVQIVFKSIPTPVGCKAVPKKTSVNKTTKTVKPRISRPSPKKLMTLTKTSPTIVRRRSYTTSSVQVRKLRLKEKSNYVEIERLEFKSSNDVDKENIPSPQTPKNASELFDKINFTPATETKERGTSNLEYMASLPTPTTVSRFSCLTESTMNVKSNIQTVQTMRIEAAPQLPRFLDDLENLENLMTPQLSRQTKLRFEPDICSTVTSQKGSYTDSNEVSRTTVESLSPSNKTFEIEGAGGVNVNSGKPQPTEDLNIVNNLTHVVSTSLMSIIEESGESNDDIYKLSNRSDTNRSRFDVEFPSTPLRKIISLNNLDSAGTSSSGSSRAKKSNDIEFFELNNPVSLPNLYDSARRRTAAECASTTATTRLRRGLSTQINFQENEICAQSSCLNLYNKQSPQQRSTLSANGQNQSIESIEEDQSGSCEFYVNAVNDDGASEFQKPRPKIQNATFHKQKTTEMTTVKRVTNLVLKKNITTTTTSTTTNLNKIASSAVRYANRHNYEENDVRVPLFNHNYILHDAINPDPFSATTTSDPFMSSTMYLNKVAVERIENDIKKWLNALVTIPEEIDSSEKIDYGKLFQDVINKDLKLAPTKEKISSKYFTKYRMISLRKTAFNLFHSEELCIPISKMLVVIEKKQLSMRTDRNLHLDLPLQRNILELLLSFNPLWLRIGLEVVFNEEIPMSSNSDIYGLSAFIINRIFRDRNLETTSKHSRYTTYTSEYAEKIKMSALKNVLMLVLFLDKAKEKRIIKHNPCLFVRRSPIKETREILIQFSSSLIANIGDITKYLRRLGYALNHKQTYLDEFDYAFSNLAVDLRDGVRLTRVMEIILMREDLSPRLRVPAISRLQKLHNVELGLKALSDAEFVIFGDIRARDIVDGHREKTLSLLWQIIYKFRAPKFNAAAKTIQLWWRTKWLRVVIERRIKYKHEMMLNRSATIIQSWIRGYMSRRRTEEIRVTKIRSTIVIQKFARRYLEMKRFMKIKQSVLMIQRWYRSQKTVVRVRREYTTIKTSTILIQQWFRRIVLARKLLAGARVVQMVQDETRLKYEAARVIARVYKSVLIRRKLRGMVEGIVRFQRKQNHRHRCATLIQATYIGWRTHRNYQTTRTSVILIQRWWRSVSTARHYQMMRQSAITIQRHFRNLQISRQVRADYKSLKAAVHLVENRVMARNQMRTTRQHYQKLRHTVINIQRKYRGIIAMRKCRTEFLQLHSSTVTLQKYIRSYLTMKKERQQYLLLKNSVTFIQIMYRSQLLMRQERNRYIQIRNTAIFVQRTWRQKLLLQQDRTNYLTQRQAIVTIQQRFRANIAMYTERETYQRTRELIVAMQRRYRAKCAMILERRKFLRLKESTIILQQRFRAQREMIKARNEYQLTRSSAINIQKNWRTKMAVQKFKCVRQSIILIQRWYRRCRIAQQTQSDYQIMKSKVLFVQQIFRAKLLMRIERTKYLTIRKSIITIQRRFRAQSAMKIKCREYMTIRTSTILIQQYFRGYLMMRTERENFVQLRQSAIKVQQRFRAQLAMRHTQMDYKSIRNATINIQRWYRSVIETRNIRNEYLALRERVVFVQRQYRALIKMRQERNAYLCLKQTIIFIQRRYREKILTQAIRQEYLLVTKSIVTIQTRYRAQREMLIARHQFLLLRQCVVYVQRKFRANQLMLTERTQFETIRQQTITIQRKWRATLEMRRERAQYLSIKKSAVTIQQRFREKRVAQQTRADYIRLRTTTITCQSIVRQIIQRRKYLATRQSICVIQSWWRSILEMRRSQESYNKLKSATLVIQQRWRATLYMRRQRFEYLTLQIAACTIQQKYRAIVQMRTVRAEYLLIQSLVRTLQIRFRARRTARIEHQKFIRLRDAVILIQRRFRAKSKMELERRQFVALRGSVVSFQAAVRGLLARSRFNELWQEMMSPEAIERRRQNTAARKIQVLWRGYKVRRKNTKNLNQIRNNLKMLKQQPNKNSTTLKSNLVASLKFFRGRYNTSDALYFLKKMDLYSRTLPHLLIEDSEFIANYCYETMAMSIRSESDKIVIEYCSRIILNFARYRGTMHLAFQPNRFVTIAQMLLRFCDKDCAIFDTLCSLIWVFAHDARKNRIIRSFMIEPNAIYMLRETKKMVARKEKMWKNDKRRNLKNQTMFEPNTLPSLEPDYGVIRGHPYVFVSSVFGFGVILDKLNIKL